MLWDTRYFSLIVAIILVLLSSIAFAFNYFFLKFPGNNYFPYGMSTMAASLFLILLGAYFLFDKKSPYLHIARELVYFFLVITIITFVTNAVQYTPFSPIDKKLIAIDSSLHIHLQKIMAWTADRPKLRRILALSYDSLPYQMAYLPLVLIAARKFRYLHEYYTLLLLTCLLGFSVYYFAPTKGPSSFIDSAYFMKEQYATGIKFTEIHQYKLPTTIDGGLIAMPSFHVIWAWLCLYLVRGWPAVFALLLPINTLLLIACVLLGWHYFIDLVGSIILLVVAHTIHFYCVNVPQKNTALD